MSESPATTVAGGSFDPRPRLVLRIGVAGHRPDPDKKRLLDEAGISKAAGAFLDVITQALAQFHSEQPALFRAETPLVRVFSGLAEGADQLVSTVAVERQGGMELAAILPFPVAACAALMETKKGRTRFNTLSARCAAVLQCTDEAPPLGPAKADEQARREGYVAQSEILIEHSDIIFAVWDGAPSKGPGGTAGTVRRALDLGLPVFVISEKGENPRWLNAGRFIAEHGSLAGEADADMARAILRRLLDVAPADLKAGNGHSDKQDHDTSHDHSDEGDARTRLSFFLAETSVPYGGETTLPRLGLHGFIRKWLSGKGIRKALQRLRPSRQPIQPKAGLWASAVDGLNVRTDLEGVVAQRWQWSDALAIRYAELNRSSIIAVPLLGFMAVAFGLFGFILASTGGAAGYAMKAVLLLLELALLLFAYERHFKEPRKGHWHRKQVEYRSLAELLRHERFLHLAGFGGHVARAGAQAGLPDEWIGWYLRATIRELGFPSATLGPAHYAEVIRRARDIEILDETDGQLAYNKSTSAECHLVETKLHSFAAGLFWRLILPVGLFGIAYVGLLAFTKTGAAPASLVAVVKWFPAATSNLITACMALAPATIAALHSVRAQIDFEEQARRTSNTASKLTTIARHFTNETQDKSVSREKARRLLGELTETLSADLSGWSTVYRHKGPEQPG
ncbi:MAG: hypothetical protein ACRCWO_05150 [Bosea sp. (in: a-proteobacteria)]